MRTTFGFAACLVFATACAAPSADSDGTATNAALAAAPTPAFLCLIPKAHPWDANGDVWSVDITSGFGPPREKKVEKTTGFFWGGGLTDLYEPDSSDVFWRITSTDETNGLHVKAFSAKGTVKIDLTAKPGETDPTQGTVRVDPYVGQGETISIVGARSCPAATMPRIPPG